MLLAGAAGLVAGYLISGFVSSRNKDSAETPGESLSLKKRALDTCADMMQKFAPLKNIHSYLHGWHFYNGDIKRQVEAHHYCGHLNDDVHQCVIYDKNGPDARLIGVEYIISRDLFDALPDDEKPYWHSHVHEVRSGTLVAPGLTESAETALMKDYVDTYGKTYHTWRVDRGDALPLGPSQLMMAFTKDGQINAELLKKRKETMGVDSEEVRKRRASALPCPTVTKGADAWEKGVVYQLAPQKIKPRS